MKAFVTGATGFIGSHLVDRLLLNGETEEVRCLVRKKERWLSGKPYRRIDGDLFDPGALRRGLEGVDTLFHLAAVVKAPERSIFQRINVEATENLVRLALEAGVRKLVILSSLAAAGPSGGKPVTEEDPVRPVSMYGESKKEMERNILAMVPDDISTCILRPPAVYGPREEQIYTWFRIASRRVAPVVGDGNRPRLSLIHVSDLVDALILAAKSQPAGSDTYFVSGPGIVDWNTMVRETSRILGKKIVPLYIRPGLVRGIAALVESSASLIGFYPVLNREKAGEMILEWTCDDSKARRELRYSPGVSLQEGLEQTLNWYRKHHWL